MLVNDADVVAITGIMCNKIGLDLTDNGDTITLEDTNGVGNASSFQYTVVDPAGTLRRQPLPLSSETTAILTGPQATTSSMMAQARSAVLSTDLPATTSFSRKDGIDTMFGDDGGDLPGGAGGDTLTGGWGADNGILGSR